MLITASTFLLSLVKINTEVKTGIIILIKVFTASILTNLWTNYGAIEWDVPILDEKVASRIRLWNHAVNIPCRLRNSLDQAMIVN